MLLKNCYRQYRQYSKVQTVLKNNLISLLDTVFPNVNRLFSSPIRRDGSEKWVDFMAEFWHSINTLMLCRFSQVMCHQSRVIAAHRTWCIEQRSQQILPDIPNPRCILLQAVHDETDMLAVQLQQL